MTNHTIVVIRFIKIFFYTVLLCILSISLDLFCFYRSLPFLSFIVPIFGLNAPLMFPVFLKRSLAFPLLLFSSVIKHCLLKKPFLSLLAILGDPVFTGCTFISLPCFLLLFVLLLFVRPPQIITLPSCFSFSLGWYYLPSPVQY